MGTLIALFIGALALITTVLDIISRTKKKKSKKNSLLRVIILLFLPSMGFSQIQHIEHGEDVKTHQYNTEIEFNIGYDQNAVYAGSLIEYEGVYYIQFYMESFGQRGDLAQIELETGRIVTIIQMNSNEMGTLWCLGDTEISDHRKQVFMMHQLSLSPWVKIEFKDRIINSNKKDFFQRHISKLDLAVRTHQGEMILAKKK